MGDLFENVVREAEGCQPRESVVVEIDALETEGALRDQVAMRNGKRGW